MAIRVGDPMSTVIGLDLSLTRTGIAIWRDGQMRTASVQSSPDGKSWDARNNRTVSLTLSIMRWLRENTDGIDLAVIEGPILHGPQNGSFFDRAQLWGFVFSQLRSKTWRVPVAVVNNQTLKAWATGKADTADKDAMLAAARETWPRTANHDEADSAWLACMGAVKLGDYPPVALTEWRLNGLTKPEWPKEMSA